ncbi:hypothetical protein [Vibrio mexicanus]|uniref:hypothetical protein n=1 Tax=Vibrio mexicanus TaxID=1004326 RepID=UPI00069BA879|nr:hypothetical protein [Vibrio mexicanus]
MFATDTAEGADGASLTRIEGTTDGNSSIVFGGPRGTYIDSVDLRSGRQNIRVYEEIDDGNGTPEVRQLGVLRINSNGEAEFRASADLEHNGQDIEFSINVTATDGDLDTSTMPLNVSISDRDAAPISLKVVTFEDSGRSPLINYEAGDAPELENQQDNQDGLSDSPAQVSLQVNLFDYDNNESIGGLTIKAGNHRGDFYYQDESGIYHRLEADATSNEITFESPLLQQDISVVDGRATATIENLYFVPDRHYSTGNGGVRINYQLQIHNDGSPDHTVDSSFRIEIESVADQAVWDDSRSTYYYETDEDGSDVRLQLRATSQDTSSRETLTYELTVTEGAGSFEMTGRNGQVFTPDANGIYTIPSNQINRITINPKDNYAGR